jgi:hypothetical protein
MIGLADAVPVVHALGMIRSHPECSHFDAFCTNQLEYEKERSLGTRHAPSISVRICMIS